MRVGSSLQLISHVKVCLLRDRLSNEAEADGSNWIFNSRELAITIVQLTLTEHIACFMIISSLHNNSIRLL